MASTCLVHKIVYSLGIFYLLHSDYLKTYLNNILISYRFFDGCKTSVVSRQTYKSGFFCLIYFPGEICVVGREWRSLRHRECAWSFLFFCRELTENARYKIFLYLGGEGAQSNLHCFCYVMRWQEPTNLEQKKVIFSNPMTSDFTMVSGNIHYQIFLLPRDHKWNQRSVDLWKDHS